MSKDVVYVLQQPNVRPTQKVPNFTGMLCVSSLCIVVAIQSVKGCCVFWEQQLNVGETQKVPNITGML